MERDLPTDRNYCNKCTQEPGTVCINSLRGRLVFRPTGTPLEPRLREPFEVTGTVSECPYRLQDESQM